MHKQKDFVRPFPPYINRCPARETLAQTDFEFEKSFINGEIALTLI